MRRGEMRRGEERRGEERQGEERRGETRLTAEVMRTAKKLCLRVLVFCRINTKVYLLINWWIFCFVYLFAVKRFREPVGVRRPWRIWFFDTSKQAIGALFIHFANVFLSTLTEEDPCSLYLMNFLLDAMLGMLVIWLAVKLVSKLVEYKEWTLLTFGEYGDPPQAAAWLGQCGIYLLIMVLEKGVISLVLLVPGWSKLQEVLLSYIANPQLELVIVMLIVPFIVNSIMFWVIDSLMMRKYKTMKSLDDSCDSSVKKADSPPWATDEESRVLLTVETDTEEASEGEEEPGDAGPVPYVQYSGGPVRPSWVVV
ncbi:transmembrane protein 110, like isoform X1 [Scomber scombrus]|uniref:transmembrane protein 110, like isoform X1 n=1 Tax=Scomber scombrus TaxID=13677 RepID=UPI002DD92363|nr:transmembrane protein 110, like isoform X1 [Scomber scombrus]